MRRLHLLCFTVLALLPAAPALAQPDVQVDSGFADFERDTGNVPVGFRGVYVGLVTAASARSADPVVLSVNVPGASADSLCIDLISRNGRYEGRFRYSPPRRAGRLTLTLPTRYAHRLREYGPTRLAPMAHLSPTCSQDRGLTLPAAWGDTTPPRRLRLLLNVASDVYAVSVRPQGEQRGIRCTRLDDPGATAFDYECLVELPAVAGTRVLTILQRAFGGHPDPEIVRVWVPDGS